MVVFAAQEPAGLNGQLFISGPCYFYASVSCIPTVCAVYTTARSTPSSAVYRYLCQMYRKWYRYLLQLCDFVSCTVNLRQLYSIHLSVVLYTSVSCISMAGVYCTCFSCTPLSVVHLCQLYYISASCIPLTILHLCHLYTHTVSCIPLSIVYLSQLYIFVSCTPLSAV
jgi:hypothetical protein